MSIEVSWSLTKGQDKLGSTLNAVTWPFLFLPENITMVTVRVLQVHLLCAPF